MNTFLEIVKVARVNVAEEENTGFLPMHLRLRAHVELFFSVVIDDYTDIINMAHHELCLCDDCVFPNGQDTIS